ncbi:serine O-acetyltransferase EpsC [Rariglobus hedericola]|uniref:Serine acetyltransferase n=1 Tax=Rariglobus hedericola TaxID=2597822 RepID=A0A556QQI5_9BACT|nr:serine O-acetyltransferase EpsC [Rariglobus hedericola]TSJ78900.1 serine acetyltransferase [Rariglobus hedericola]
MTLDDITKALLASYETEGGINHLDGINLPSDESVNRLASDFMHLLFPGFFEQKPVTKKEVPALTASRLGAIQTSLSSNIEKALSHARTEDASVRAASITTELLSRLPDIRRIVQTDVQAAYNGDPAARSTEEIILAYPCVLVISLQRIAHELYKLGVPILPRMLTEYAHERTGTDIHPGAQIGTHFFIDHCTGVVIGETARIGNHVKIYQGVTLGAKSFEVDNDGNPIKGVKRHPDIDDNVTIYAHATILGGDTKIGAHSIIGANVWILEPVPSNSIAYYKNENLVIRSRRKKEKALECREAAEMQAWDWSI